MDCLVRHPRTSTGRVPARFRRSNCRRINGKKRSATMFTFRRLALVVVIAGLASGCERQSMASTEVDADLQAAATQGPGASASETSDPLRPVFGAGDVGFVPRFLSSQTIGNSAIFDRDGKFVT